jgi:putative oxidoreductase
MKYNFMFLDKYRDFGLLLLRVGIGVMFMVYHGWPKLIGGPERWAALGEAMGGLGVTFAPVIWGFLAAVAETLGALLLVLGLFTRYALFFLFFTMVVAAMFHLGRGDGVKGAAHAIEIGIVFLSLMFIGPGKYSLDAR